MKDKVFLHTKENISIIVKKYLLCLLPLIIYGIYKNGYLLYSRNLISFPEIFKIVYLLLISFCVYLIINKLIFKKSFWSLDLVFILVIPLFMPSNINIVIYTLGLFISYLLVSILGKKLKFNKMAFCKLFIILLLVLFSNYTYLNSGEALNIYSLNLWDNLWGRNIGGIATSNIILGLIILIIFCLTNIYKKSVAISSLLTFLILTLILNDFNINIITYSTPILGIILLNIDTTSTPVTKKAMIIYGTMHGILTSILTTYLNLNEGVFISTLFLSFFALCRFVKHKLQSNDKPTIDYLNLFK